MLERLARFVLRHRKPVIVGWLIVMLCGGFASSQLSKRAVIDFSLPGQRGQVALDKIRQAYGVDVSDAYLPLVTLPAGQRVVDHKAETAAVFDAIIAKNPTFKMLDYATTGDSGFITQDGRTTFAMMFEPTPVNIAGFNIKPKILDPLKAALPPGASGALTNSQLISSDGGSNGGPSLLLEVLFGGLGALALLAFVFASFLAFVPIVIAAFSILTTLLMLYGLTYLTHVNFIVQFLVSLIGLGVSIDYSLLVVTRWREERDHGRQNHDAIVEAVRTAGHAVVSSAGTVAIGLCALAVLPIPFLRSVGFGGLLIPLAATLATLTFLPAILGGIGPRIDWPKVRHEDKASKSWTRWAAGVVKHRWLAAGGAILVLVALIIPFSQIRIGTPASDAIGHKNGDAYAALTTLKDGGKGTGLLTPISLLVKGDSTPFVDATKDLPGIASVIAPSGSAWVKNGERVIFVTPVHETVAGPSTKIVTTVRNSVKSIPGFVGVAGAGAGQQDFIHGVYGNFPLIFGLILLLTFILLARSFRSVLLPLKAVLLNAISLAATYGLVVFFWQHGHGSSSVFGIAATGAITFWVPMMIFAFLFGLSMDYEVFILARMREEYDRTGSTDLAVIQGIGRTGRLVTCAALVLFLSFVSLAATPDASTKIMATALGAGILLDATIVRALLVPALVSLFGDWNWYLPDWLAKALRVKPSHALHQPPTALAD